MSRGAFSNSQRQAIYQREDQCCAWCGKHAQGGSVQHRTARGMGGTRRKVTLADGVLLCGSATTGDHGMFESRPEIALRYGYRVPQSMSADETPIFIWGHGWVLLAADGTYTSSSDPFPAGQDGAA